MVNFNWTPSKFINMKKQEKAAVVAYIDIYVKELNKK